MRRGFSATGGAEAYLLRLAGALATVGITPDLLTTQDWPESAWHHGRRVVLPGKSPRQFAEAVNAWRLRQSSPPVLFSLERVPGCTVFRAGDGVHAAWLRRRRRFEAPWRGWFRRWNRKHAQLLALEKAVFDPENTRAVIANSHLVAREMAEFFCYPEERVHVIPNGYDPPGPPPTAMERREARQHFCLPENHFTALFVGSGWERKGLRHAIEACAQLPHAQLLVAGRGPQTACRAPGVHHLGPVSDLRPCHAAADVLLHPTWYDPFSNACLEAWTAGLPVITTRDNGMGELLEEGRTGSVVPRADSLSELVQALTYWSKALERDREKVVQACAAAAAPWTTQRNLEATLEVVREVMER